MTTAHDVTLPPYEPEAGYTDEPTAGDRHDCNRYGNSADRSRRVRARGAHRERDVTPEARWQKLQRTANLQIGIFCAILIGLAGFVSLLTGDPLPVACISYTCIVVGLLLLLLHL